MKSNLNFLLKTLLTLLICSWSFSVFTKEVAVNTAKNVAINLYTERADNLIPNDGISRIIEEKEKGETIFYVMIFSEKGFVLVSADDIVQPILGYSFESTYDENNHSPAFEFFILKRYKKEIYAAKQAKVTANIKTTNNWAKYLVDPTLFQSKDTTVENPLLTTIWHQRWPYNALCPEDTSSCNTCNDHVVVGCVATAMAQVLNFWQHPWHGTSSHSYTHPEYGELSADFENTYYNFDKMPDTATEYSEDLAELNYHCGVAVNMNYGPNSSGAWGDGSEDVANALKNYFYFSQECEDISRSSYSDSEWIDLLKVEINSGRPVIYGSHDNDNDSGHAWVLDGASTDDFFNCNWGWGGGQNGWFSINDLTPGTHNYDSQQHASVNIHPKTGSLSGTLTYASSPYKFNFDQVIESNQQLTIEPGVEVIFNGRYKLIVRGQLNAEGYNGGFINFNAQIPEIGMQGVKFENLNDNAMDSSKMFYCRFENGKGTWDPYNRISQGGGVYCNNSSKVFIKRSRIFKCQADYGGGISCLNNSGIRLHHNLIDGDTATFYGGGMFLDNSDVVLTENHFNENHTTGTYGMYSSGGGIYCRSSNITLFKDVIEYNNAFTVGGVGFDLSEAVLDSVIINDNQSAGLAGGMFVYNSSDIILNGCQIFNNDAINEGGGGLNIHDNSSLEMNHSLVYNNYAIYGTSFTLTSNSTASVNNCTLADNFKNPTSSFQGITVGSSSTLSLKNSILWDNGTIEIVKDESSIVDATYSVIENGNWTGTGVTSGNPLFYSPSVFNYNLTWYGFPIPDEQRSSGIDSGDPSSPLDPDGTRADMGALPYEQTYTSIPGGNISGTLTCADSPYYVYGDLEILSTDELIIEPCVTVIFQGDYKLEVSGRLLAEGTETDRITFAAADTVECWQGLKIVNTN